MIRKKWNNTWQITKTEGSAMNALFSRTGGQEQIINLPHDAMIHEKRQKDAPGGAQTGFYPGGQYVYSKDLDAPEDWENKAVYLEFEGIYQTAMVYVNGALAVENVHGYSEFRVCLDSYLNYGEKNSIKIIADNTAQPNSRWYSGSGVYRNVNLLIADKMHIVPDGVKIRTVYASEESALVEVRTVLFNQSGRKRKINVCLELAEKNGGEKICDYIPATLLAGEKTEIRQTFCIKNPRLWDCETPVLYQCQVKLTENGVLLDQTDDYFGIRTVSIDSEYGLRINGKNVKLRGTCIHHDNGIIGASEFEAAAFRKCRLLKEAGFNSIRSAHNPLSRAMLTACDYYGILVMDELSDVWTFHKNTHDFASHFEKEWETEIERMVEKDYNHPSVILYSTGNEIQELGTEAGARMNRKLGNKFHELDRERYTTVGLNGMMALAFNGKIVDVIKDIAAKQSGANGQDGVNAMNSLMGSIMSGEGADNFSVHPVLSEVIEESELASDVIGLNYLTGRHVLEKELHPHKAIVGTETYPADIFRLWKLVEEYPHILGDYTWTGYDYLGEAGCGIFHYDGNVNFSDVWPERAAYIGDIDLVGNRRPVSFYREIVYGLRKEPYIAVERLDRYGQEPSKTAWMFKDNLASWTWPGYEGKPAVIEVYAKADEAELFLNGKSLGRKPVGEKEQYRAAFEMTYVPGELTAVSYCDGKEQGRFTLRTAGKDTVLTAEADKNKLTSDGMDLAFIQIGFTDKAGNENLSIHEKIKIAIEGEAVLEGFGSADPASLESYDDTEIMTFDGKALAVIRSLKKEGMAKVRVTSEAYGSRELIFQVK